MGLSESVSLPGCRVRGRRRRAVALTVALGLGTCLWPAIARGDDLQELLDGHHEYRNGNYDAAVARLRALLDRPGAALDAPALTTPARMYLAASLFAQRAEREAEQAVTVLLRDDPDAQPDVNTFEPAFAALFTSVRARLEPELRRIREERIVERERQARERAARRERVLGLLAREPVREVPRVLMFAPFGIGHFSNGDNALGGFFLSVEGAFLAANLAFVGVHELMFPRSDDELLRYTSQTRETLEFYREGSLVFLGIFGVALLTDIVVANLRYQRYRPATTRPGSVPPAMRNLEISVAPPGAVGLGLRF